MPDQPTITDQVSKLYQSIAGFHTTHLLEIGRELGVWEHLTANPGQSSGDVAATLELDPFFTDILCKTAFSSEILERSDAGWVMAPHMDELLGSPGATFDLSRAARTHLMLADDYAHYPKAFRDGGSDLTYQAHDAAFMSEVASSLRSLPSIFLESVVPQLPDVGDALADAGRLLDVGCGAGWAVATLAERYPLMRVVGVEVEPVSVDMARVLIEERGLADRCEIVHGDASAFASDDPFDLATLFLVYHEIIPTMKRSVLRAIRQALRPGGLVVIYDEVYPDDDGALRTMPSRFSAFAQWYELIWGNVVGTRDDVVADIAASGLELRHDMAFSRYHIFVAARPA